MAQFLGKRMKAGHCDITLPHTGHLTISTVILWQLALWLSQLLSNYWEDSTYYVDTLDKGMIDIPKGMEQSGTRLYCTIMSGIQCKICIFLFLWIKLVTYLIFNIFRTWLTSGNWNKIMEKKSHCVVAEEGAHHTKLQLVPEPVAEGQAEEAQWKT